jgi:hypothetical protein
VAQHVMLAARRRRLQGPRRRWFGAARSAAWRADLVSPGTDLRDLAVQRPGGARRDRRPGPWRHWPVARAGAGAGWRRRHLLLRPPRRPFVPPASSGPGWPDPATSGQGQRHGVDGGTCAGRGL